MGLRWRYGRAFSVRNSTVLRGFGFLLDDRPEGRSVDPRSVRRHVLLNLLHYDKPSLLSGKLHALMHRSYVKGRDVYDLVWYLSDRSWPTCGRSWNERRTWPS